MENILKYIKTVCIELENAVVENALEKLNCNLSRIAISEEADNEYPTLILTQNVDSDKETLLLLLKGATVEEFTNEVFTICNKYDLRRCYSVTKRFKFIDFKEEDGSDLIDYHGVEMHYYIVVRDEVEFHTGIFDRLDNTNGVTFAIIDGFEIRADKCATDIKTLIDFIDNINYDLAIEINDNIEDIDNTEQGLADLYTVYELNKKEFTANEVAMKHYKQLLSKENK